MDSLAQAKRILSALPGVTVQDADSALCAIRPRRDYDNDFVLVGLKLPKPSASDKTLSLPADVLSVFAQARKAVHPEYLQILVRHADRIWAFDHGMLVDVTEDTNARKNPAGRGNMKKYPKLIKNPIARELYDLANYGCKGSSCGHQHARRNPVEKTPFSRSAVPQVKVERFMIVDEDGEVVSPVVEGRSAANLMLRTMRSMHPGVYLDIAEVPKELINPARRNPAAEPNFVYHGTSYAEYKKMRLAGFRTGPGGLYVKDDDQFDHYAEEQSREDGSEPIVLVFDRDELEQQGTLRPDLYWDADSETEVDLGQYVFHGYFGFPALIGTRPFDK